MCLSPAALIWALGCMYERLVLLTSILRNIYIDDEWVAKEYLKWCKKGAWKEENTQDMHCQVLES